MPMKTIREKLGNPLSKAAAVAGAFGLALKPQIAVAVGMTAWESAGLLFAGVSASRPYLDDWLPNWAAMYIDELALGLLLLFLAKIGYRVYQNYEDNESQV